ncbi:TPA: type II toxin-antitoxin system YafO family toxin [Escherichia coli]|uniref:type II toxin-antitoxin system YafO family toxin n=1 Tax=Escherichia coli TaxID=562 RepID=UPI00158E47FD|nr:type II toxin-antitoxin system YafO family toxin [Escherichia coli]HBC2924085.1 type II toxin-antitoxin system YafO family toxin [Escherichia coli O146]EEV1982745.1 hypothetical protein [Escherichia coli]EFA1273275.1 hypothetical protein [Escherichia coli]EFL6124116.1 hypothetical protein [Escherichia coli]EIG2357703.1 type II toxin-antitoxin system YafO family toxin [Escherichia coli]
MNHFVSIGSPGSDPFLDEHGLFYARQLAALLNGDAEAGYLGRVASFERNFDATSEGIKHIHIRIAGKEEPWSSKVRRFERKSDNFLIYATHWFYGNYHQVLAIVSPDAHHRIDSILPDMIDYVARNFSPLTEEQLKALGDVGR